jgi:hypothetical protein
MAHCAPSVIPDAAQHEMMRRRSGIAIPYLQRPAVALRRARDDKKQAVA